jgi:hypothetical protein
MISNRRATLVATLGLPRPRATGTRAAASLHRCFDTWREIGDIGMQRQGFRLHLINIEIET